MTRIEVKIKHGTTTTCSEDLGGLSEGEFNVPFRSAVLVCPLGVIL